MELIWQSTLCAECNGLDVAAHLLVPRSSPLPAAFDAMPRRAAPYGNATPRHPAPQAAQEHRDCEPRNKHTSPPSPFFSAMLPSLLALPLRQPSANVGVHVPIYSICQGTIRGVAFYAGEEPPIIARFLILVITSLLGVLNAFT